MTKPVKKINIDMISFKEYIQEATEGKMNRTFDAIQKQTKKIFTKDFDIEKVVRLHSRFSRLNNRLNFKNEKVGAELRKSNPNYHERIVNTSNPHLKDDYKDKELTSIEDQIVGNHYNDEKNMMMNPERQFQKMLSLASRGIRPSALN